MSAPANGQKACKGPKSRSNGVKNDRNRDVEASNPVG